MSRDCLGTPTTPVENPAEFSRAPKFLTPCVSYDGLTAAYSERDVGPIGVALFLGAPSRAYPAGDT